MIRTRVHSWFCRADNPRPLKQAAKDAYFGGWKYYCPRCGRGWGRFR